MIKENTIVNFDIYSDPSSPGIADKFRLSFGSWTSAIEGGKLEYVRNENKPFIIAPADEYVFSGLTEVNGRSSQYQQQVGLSTRQAGIEVPGGFEVIQANFILPSSGNINHLVVVPTLSNSAGGPLGTILPEQIYRQSFYIVDKRGQSELTSLEPNNLIQYGLRFSNYATSFRIGNSLSEIKDLSRVKAISPTVTHDVHFEYKNESVDYETKVQNIPTEKEIPNYYEMMMNADYNTETVTISDIVDDITNTTLTDANKRQNQSTIIIPPELMKDYSDLTTEADTAISTDNYGNRVEILETHQNLKDVVSASQVFNRRIPYALPYYVKIDFNQLREDLEVPDDAKYLRDNYMFFSARDGASLNSNEKHDLATLLMRWHSEYKNFINEGVPFTMNMPRVDAFGKVENVITTDNLYSYDLLKLALEFFPSILNGANQSNITFLNKFFNPPVDNPISVDMAQPNIFTLLSVLFPTSKIFHSLAGLPATLQTSDASGYVEETYKNVFHLLDSYEQMIKCGGKEQSELLFYKIDKYLGETVGPNQSPIQTIYIPNIFPYTKDYVDTQIKYGTYYTYKISEVRAVLGSEYEYFQVPQPEVLQGSNKLLFGVKQYPRIRIMEVPVFEKTGRVLASPPLSPEFEVIPVRRRSNQFKLFMKSSYGRTKAYPIPISSFMATSMQNLLDNNSFYEPQINFNDISSVARFDIYYTDTKPINALDPYRGLVDNLYTSISVDINPDSKLSADSATAVLKLVPNTKYYFCFVSVNRLGVSSNPSPIYEFEMINDSGYSYVDYKQVLFSNDVLMEVRKNSKTINKFFSIKPSISQVLIDYPGSGLVATENEITRPLNSRGKALKFGLEQDSLFPVAAPREKNSGKKIKLRIKSVHTNKAYDLNITFKHERVESMFDKEIPYGGLTTDTTLAPNGTSLEEIAKTTPAYWGKESNEYIKSVQSQRNCGKGITTTQFYYPQIQQDNQEVFEEFIRTTLVDSEITRVRRGFGDPVTSGLGNPTIVTPGIAITRNRY